MKLKVSMLAAVLVLFVTVAIAQKPMDSASEKAVKITQGPTISDNNGSTATLTWTTDRQGANHVQYRKAGSNDPWKSAYHSGGGTTHTLQLTGLTPGQTYEYQILTQDGDVRTSGQFQAGSGTGTAATPTTPASTPASTGAPNVSAGDKVALYREVGPGGVHTFTTSATSTAAGFHSEGLAGYVLSSQKAGTVPLYRLTNAQGDTLLTTDQTERTNATGMGYKDDGTVGYIASSRWGGTTPMYRMAGPGGHFYTVSDSEHASAQQLGYHDESTLGYIWTQQ
jgi:hypothetical protein